MRALIVDPLAPLALRLAKVPEPVPGPGQVLLAVHHVSLNYGDLNDARSGRLAPGGVVGSDAAGVVVQAAADGSGPPARARVVALTSGAFAERAAVKVGALAEVPSAVDLAEAAALPVAGVAALRALRAAGSLLGKRVLVTGASGGVGRFAVQIGWRGRLDQFAEAAEARLLVVRGGRPAGGRRTGEHRRWVPDRRGCVGL